jgi:hypothetical protein
MDSKEASLPLTDAEEAAPPSYTEPICNFPSSTSQYYSAKIQTQLLSLTTQISTFQTQRSLLSQAQDEKILSLLAAEIQTFFSDFAASGKQRGTLILVPASALPDQSARPVEYDFRDPREYDGVARVRDREAVDGVGGWNEDLWYWRDEEMAGRLAAYLRPAPPPDLARKEWSPRKEETEIKASEQAQEQAESSGRWRWGRMKRATRRSGESPILVEDRRDAKVYPGEDMATSSGEDRVLMDVNADEVTFRTENDLGLFETQTGWAIVLKLKIEMGRREDGAY